jgi:hypothetical protein
VPADLCPTWHVYKGPLICGQLTALSLRGGPSRWIGELVGKLCSSLRNNAGPTTANLMQTIGGVGSNRGLDLTESYLRVFAAMRRGAAP